MSVPIILAVHRRRAAPASEAGTSLLELVLCILLTGAFCALVWNVFAGMPAYGGQPTPPTVVARTVPVPPPVCFNHTREQVIGRNEQAMSDIAAGCPAEPMAYHAAMRAEQGRTS